MILVLSLLVAFFIACWLLGDLCGYLLTARKSYKFSWRVFLGPDNFLEHAKRRDV